MNRDDGRCMHERKRLSQVVYVDHGGLIDKNELLLQTT